MNLKVSRKRATIIGLAVVLGFFVLTAESCGDDGDQTAKNQEELVADQQLSQYLISQPVPEFNWSQLRQNLIEIQTAQANTTATTSFFLNVGIADPVDMCPSIGFPIPATYQLTNPDQITKVDTPGEGGDAAVTAQLEATGVYTEDTTGTYVVCVSDNGTAAPTYHEGYVLVKPGPAKWDYDKHMAVMTGDPSIEMSIGQD